MTSRKRLFLKFLFLELHPRDAGSVFESVSSWTLWRKFQSCSRLSVLSSVLWKWPRLVPLPLCRLARWQQPFSGTFLQWRNSVSTQGTFDRSWFLCKIMIFIIGLCSSPKPRPSFQTQQVTAPVPPINYRQGDPIFTEADGYFTIPQVSEEADLMYCMLQIFMFVWIVVWN